MLKVLDEKPGGEWRSLPRKDEYLMGQGTILADLERSSGTLWWCGPLPEMGASPRPQLLLSQDSVPAQCPQPCPTTLHWVAAQSR